MNICLVKYDVDLSDFQIVRDDGSVVQAENWNSLVRTEMHPIITISLNLLTSNVQESTSHPEAPSTGESDGDDSDSTELAVREEQDSGDEVDRDQSSTGERNRDDSGKFTLTFNQEEHDSGNETLIKLKLPRPIIAPDQLSTEESNRDDFDSDQLTVQQEKHDSGNEILMKVKDHRPIIVHDQPSTKESNRDDFDSPEQAVREEQVSGDEVLMPTRRTTFDRDQTSQDGQLSPRLHSTQFEKIEETRSKHDSVHQRLALAEMASNKDDSEPVKTQKDARGDTEGELLASRKASGSRRGKSRRSSNIENLPPPQIAWVPLPPTAPASRAVPPTPPKAAVSQGVAPNRSTALIRASKGLDDRHIHTSTPISRDRKYPQKVSIEVVNEEDEDDNHDIYYTFKSLDPQKIDKLLGPTHPQKSETKVDHNRQSSTHQTVDSMQVLLNDSLQSTDQSSVISQNGQSKVPVPPALSWKTGKPSDIADEETETQHEVPGKSKRRFNLLKELLVVVDCLVDPQTKAANLHQSVGQEDDNDELLGQIQEKLLREKLWGQGKLYRRATKGPRQTIQHLLEQRSAYMQDSINGKGDGDDKWLTYEVLVCEVVKLMVDSFKFFVPFDKICNVADKYWGSTDTLIEVTRTPGPII